MNRRGGTEAARPAACLYVGQEARACRLDNVSGQCVKWDWEDGAALPSLWGRRECLVQRSLQDRATCGLHG